MSDPPVADPDDWPRENQAVNPPGYTPAGPLPILSQSEREQELEAALFNIVQWADAYPLGTFPEPNMAEVSKALQAAGLTLDAVSASAMRHALRGVGDIAKVALGLKVQQTVIPQP